MIHYDDLYETLPHFAGEVLKFLKSYLALNLIQISFMWFLILIPQNNKNSIFISDAISSTFHIWLFQLREMPSQWFFVEMLNQHYTLDQGNYSLKEKKERNNWTLTIF